MKIKIDSLENIHAAAKEFLANMGDGKVFAFYGKMGVSGCARRFPDRPG